MAFRLRR